MPATRTAPTVITAIPTSNRGVSFSLKKTEAANAIIGRSIASIGKILLNGKCGSKANQKKNPMAPPDLLALVAKKGSDKRRRGNDP